MSLLPIVRNIGEEFALLAGDNESSPCEELRFFVLFEGEGKLSKLSDTLPVLFDRAPGDAFRECDFRLEEGFEGLLLLGFPASSISPKTASKSSSSKSKDGRF